MTEARPLPLVPVEAPYPGDTRAKGWRFELDYERIEQSDTWSLAAEIPMAQHALLMMWLVAWTQVPCGSLPSDEAIIRAKCRIPAPVWAKCRAVVMRGWWQAIDGRLYHDTIASRVAEMLDYRRKESERRSRNRGHGKGDPVGDGGTPPGTPLGQPYGVPRDTTGVPDTGTGTGTGTYISSPAAQKTRKRAADPAPDRPVGVGARVWGDWLALRKAKNAPVTQTVLDGAESEAGKAGMTLEAFLRVWCIRGSQGLQAEWLKPDERPRPGELPGSSAPPEPDWRRDKRTRTAEFAGPAATAATTTHNPESIVDVESRLVD